MSAEFKFNPGHEDFLHDICYDYYGKRLATCSSDQKIKVWDLQESTATATSTRETEASFEWTLDDSWKVHSAYIVYKKLGRSKVKAHDASVLRVCWAHPQFGQVLASCSFDRTIRIWEEQEEEAKATSKRWVEKARLVDSRGTVQDVEFAPHHLGLKLATVSVDGMLRIYEAMDIVNLAHWTLMEDFEITQNAKEKDAEFCLSWCKSRFLAPMLVVGCGREHVAKIYRYDDSLRKWAAFESLTGHKDTIHDVSWAPSIGRSYQLVATASRDHFVRIFRLFPPSSTATTNGDESSPSSPTSSSGYRVELAAELGAHDSEVWRVEWNVTGTVLASSGDDGRVFMWKANYLGEWTQMTSIVRV